MDTPPSLLSAGLAILSALLYLIAVWRQALSLGAGEEGQRQHIALVGAAALVAHALSRLSPCSGRRVQLGLLSRCVLDVPEHGGYQPRRFAHQTASHVADCALPPGGAVYSGRHVCTRYQSPHE